MVSPVRELRTLPHSRPHETRLLERGEVVYGESEPVNREF
jgi:hypothetical protein